MSDRPIEIISDAGFHRPLISADLSWKPELLQCLRVHYCLTSIQTVLDQIRSGLDTLGVLSNMQSYPSVVKPFFCYEEALTISYGNTTVVVSRFLETFMSLIREGKVSYTDKSVDGDKWKRERSTYVQFLKYLRSCEGTKCFRERVGTYMNTILDGERSANLTDVFIFISGASFLPPEGLDDTFKIAFDHGAIFPKAQTCNLTLTIPTMCACGGDKAKLYDNLDLGFKSHGFFGQV